MSDYQKQKAAKPKINDRINELLAGTMREMALGFVAWMKEHKMTAGWASTDSWKTSYRGKGLFYIRISEGKWTVNPVFWDIDEVADYITEEGYQEFILNNLYDCRFCHPAPCRITDRIFFGKELKGLCGGRPILHCENPDERTVEFLKGLIVYMRKKISG
ncbi:MAG: hypothetical protein LBI19_02035 [Oscillospiraceae bacterium]|nr:hypothetical protein [Oscillospiraceae bacterium]